MLTLQPNLGEALMAMGYYRYACLKDYDTAVRYFEQARQSLPNSSRIPESLAYLDPMFDPLRQDPRLEKLLASAGQNDAK